MPRKISKPRPKQGARLTDLRVEAGLSQAELARLVGVPQQNVAYWELSDKPPRSDVLPKLAKVLGVNVEQLLDVNVVAPVRKGGPTGKARKVFEEVSKLPRRQQEKVIEFVTALVEQYKRS